MKVVVPMAGRGSRFADESPTVPKPLIQVQGRPMVGWALRSIEKLQYSSITFIALREHDEKFNLKKVLEPLVHGPFNLVLLDDVTEGQLCTVVESREYIDTDEDILIISSDTFVDSDIGKDIAGRNKECQGIISVASLPGTHWSFALTDKSGKVVRVAEKDRISNHASTGLYYFSNGRIFLGRASEMIRKKEKTKNEYYVIPLYQKYIDQGEWIGISEARNMYDMGNPDALRSSEPALRNLV